MKNLPCAGCGGVVNGLVARLRIAPCDANGEHQHHNCTPHMTMVDRTYCRIFGGSAMLAAAAMGGREDA